MPAAEHKVRGGGWYTCLDDAVYALRDEWGRLLWRRWSLRWICNI